MSDPITSAGQALPRAQLQAFLEGSQARLLVGFARMSAESLEAPVDGETTWAEHIAFSHWHETYHVGQLELLRQLAGKNDKVI